MANELVIKNGVVTDGSVQSATAEFSGINTHEFTGTYPTDHTTNNTVNFVKFDNGLSNTDTVLNCLVYLAAADDVLYTSYVLYHVICGTTVNSGYLVYECLAMNPSQSPYRLDVEYNNAQGFLSIRKAEAGGSGGDFRVRILDFSGQIFTSDTTVTHRDTAPSYYPYTVGHVIKNSAGGYIFPSELWLGGSSASKISGYSSYMTLTATGGLTLRGGNAGVDFDNSGFKILHDAGSSSGYAFLYEDNASRPLMFVVQGSDKNFAWNFGGLSGAYTKMLLNTTNLTLSSGIDLQITAGNLYANGNIIPKADDTSNLGTTANHFTNLYMGDDGVINFDDGSTDTPDTTLARTGANTLTLTGSLAITGTVDGVDIAAHTHENSTNQTRLASKDRKRQAQVRIPSAGATDTYEKAVFSAPEACTITKVGIITDTTLTGTDTNYSTIRFVDKGSDGSGTDSIGHRDYTSGNNATAFDLDDTYGTLTNTTLAAGDVVSIKKEVTSTGLATPDLVAIVEYTID